jgi:hypothetical protein
MPKTILGAALGNCVHVGGLHHFLKLAEAEGYRTTSLGPAVAVKRLVHAITKESPTLVAVSYRLTPEVAASLFEELRVALRTARLESQRLVFGGTPPVAEIARASSLFEAVFSGQETLESIRGYLRGGTTAPAEEYFTHTLIDRISQKYPYPLLRHHFGRPSLEETIAGARLIAEAGVLDVLSLGPDQNAQEHFFHPEEMDPAQNGAGGVPVRTPEDLRAIYQNTRCGNYPLVRCYSGTRDLIRWAEMSVEAIHNAWAAIPLTWYSVMDGRSQRPLYDAITEKQEAMRWYADRGIPVEVNESHQWSLRDAHDALAVAMAFLAAYNAKKMGVRHYVAQYMFNTPPGTTPAMDLAKMLAKKRLIEDLQDDVFTVYTEVRAGIAHFSADPAIAQGQLAASATTSLALRPHILHVVGFSEGHHATTPDELIQSCKIAHGVLQDALEGYPEMSEVHAINARKEELLNEASLLLNTILTLGTGTSEDPWTDARILSLAIKHGLLDAPHFRGNPHLCGEITTRLIHGGWCAVDGETGNILTEPERIAPFLQEDSPLRRAIHHEEAETLVEGERN